MGGVSSRGTVSSTVRNGKDGGSNSTGMGLTAQAIAHFDRLLQERRPSAWSSVRPLSASPVGSDGQSEKPNSARGVKNSSALRSALEYAADGNLENSTEITTSFIGISPRARLLRRLCPIRMWDLFLQDAAESFVLSRAEAEIFLRNAALDDDIRQLDQEALKSALPIIQTLVENVEKEVSDYLTLLEEVTEERTSLTLTSDQSNPMLSVDFMSICGSVLLLSVEIPLERKVEKMFEWISLGENDFQFDAFVIALRSFERGLSNAFGMKALAEETILDVTRQWMELASRQQSSTTGSVMLSHQSGYSRHGTKEILEAVPEKDSESFMFRMTHEMFMSFCMNRHHVIRWLLEVLAEVDVLEDTNLQIDEVTDTSMERTTNVILGGGDEWLANPAWKATARSMITPEVAKSYVDCKPSSNLTLDWVHGYRGYDCRNNVFAGDESAEWILYPAAALVIAMHRTRGEQVYLSEHGDDVTCLSTWTGSQGTSGEKVCLVASGEIGATPATYLTRFDVSKGTFERLACLLGFHKKGLAHMCFSPDGLYLFTVGVQYSVAIYDTNITSKGFGKMIASSEGPKSKFLTCCAILSEKSNNDGGRNASSYGFVTCGEKHAVRWTYDSRRGVLKQDKINVGSGNSNCVWLCAVSVFGSILPADALLPADGKSGDSCVILGAADGTLVVLGNGGASAPSASGKLKLNGSINALSVHSNRLLVIGDKSGHFHLFACCDKRLAAVCPSVQLSRVPLRSVTLSEDMSRVVVGTQNCEILDFSVAPLTSGESKPTLRLSVARVCVSGHSKGELWGLAIRPNPTGDPTRAQYATVGDDATLRLWDATTHSVLCSFPLHGVARTCDFSPDGLYIAVGLGCGATKTAAQKTSAGRVDGLVHTFRIEYNSSANSTGAISSVNSSSTIAPVAGNSDGHYQLVRISELKEPKQWISVVRFCPNGLYLAVGSRDNCLYIYSVSDQFRLRYKLSKHNAGISHLDFSLCGRYLQSCCVAYELLFFDIQAGMHLTKGASQLARVAWNGWTSPLGWPVLGIWKGTMDGSDINGVARSVSGDLLATADDFGKVCVYNWPALREGGASCHEYSGHASHVTNVRWVGGASDGNNSSLTDRFLISTGGLDKCIFQWRLIHTRSSPAAGTKHIMNVGVEIDRDSLLDDELQDEDIDLPSAGDEFLAVKPWLGAIVAPTSYQSTSGEASTTMSTAVSVALSSYKSAHDRLSNITSNSITTILSKASNGESPEQRKVYSDLQTAAANLADVIYAAGHSDSSAPVHDELELDWVHGYRGFDCRDNVLYILPPGAALPVEPPATTVGSVCGVGNEVGDNDSDEELHVRPSKSKSPTLSGVLSQADALRGSRMLIYHTAALGVVHDTASQTQTFFRGHDDDILALCRQPSSPAGQILVATAQIGPALILVWDAVTLSTVANLTPKQKNVTSLQFSQCGRYLISASQDCSLVWSDWQSGTTLVSTKMDEAPLMMSVISPTTASSSTGANRLLIGGGRQVRVWSLTGRNLTSDRVSLSGAKQKDVKALSTARFLSCATAGDSLFLGAETGQVVFMEPNARGTLESRGLLSLPPAANDATTKATTKGTKAANNSVTALITVQRPITGGSQADNGNEWLVLAGFKDGRVVVWQYNLTESSNSLPKCLGSFAAVGRLVTTTTTAPQISALSVHPSLFRGTTRLLVSVGTRGCDLFEVILNLDTGVASLFNDGAPCHLLPSSTETNSNTKELLPTPAILQRAHFQDELWGVATHPRLPLFCTVGDDKTIRFADLHTRRVLAVSSLGAVARAVAYHPTLPIVAVAFGGRVGKANSAGSGMLRLFELRDEGRMGIKSLKLAERKDASSWIADVKFSPDGQSLAIAAHDCKIYVYSLAVRQGTAKSSKGGSRGAGNSSPTLSPEESQSEDLSLAVTLKLRNTFTKHNSVVTHLDFSTDSRFIQSNCAAYELLFSDALTGRHLTSATELRDVRWASQTCTFGWPVQGIWAAEADGSDINALARSYSGHLLATADDFGQINLFRYPVLPPNATPVNASSNKGDTKAVSKAKGKTKQSTSHAKSAPSAMAAEKVSYPGHSSHVMGVSWSVGDEFLVSVGGGDKSIFVWRHRVLGSENTPVDDSVTENQETDSDSDDDDVVISPPGGGDESGCVRPWLGAVRAPPFPLPTSAAAPNVSLSLNWVHGYTVSGMGARQNVFYNTDGAVLYPAATLGILLSPNAGGRSNNAIEMKASLTASSATQTYLEGHDDDVTCLTISPNRRFLATGQIASKAHRGKAPVLIWDAIDGRLITKLDAVHQRGVRALAFNSAGDSLVTVAGDDASTHYVWKDAAGHWSRVQLVASMRGDGTPPRFVTWLPSSFGASHGTFISGGTRSLSLWRLSGSSLTRKSARMGKMPAPSTAATYLCTGILTTGTAAAPVDNVLLGNSVGDILTLKAELSILKRSAHPKAITAMTVLESPAGSSQPMRLLTGSADGLVVMWEGEATKPLMSFDLADSSLTGVLFSPVRSILSLDTLYETADGGSPRLLIGTGGGEIVEYPLQPGSSKNPNPTVHISGHYGGEVWGLAVHPTDADIYATVGDDCILRIWSVSSHRVKSSYVLPRPSRTVEWYPGSTSGGVSVLVVGFQEPRPTAAKKKTAKKKVSTESTPENQEDGANPTPVVDKCGSTYGIALLEFSVTREGAQLNLLRYFAEPLPSHKSRIFPTVTDLKFSPAGDSLAVGTKNCAVYVYAFEPLSNSVSVSEWANGTGDISGTGNSYLKRPRFTFDKHSSGVTHIDWTSNGSHFQSTDNGNELLFCDVSRGTQETSMARVAAFNNDPSVDDSVIWSTQTCNFGWAVQGIWPGNAYDSSEINAVDRHPALKYVATAEDSGLVRVLRYPSIATGAASVSCRGHASHVTNVRWTCSGQILLSTGGNDKCVFVWDLSEK